MTTNIDHTVTIAITQITSKPLTHSAVSLDTTFNRAADGSSGIHHEEFKNCCGLQLIITERVNITANVMQRMAWIMKRETKRFHKEDVLLAGVRIPGRQDACSVYATNVHVRVYIQVQVSVTRFDTMVFKRNTK